MKNQNFFFNFQSQADAPSASYHPHCLVPTNSYYLPPSSQFSQDKKYNFYQNPLPYNNFFPQTQIEYPHKTQNLNPQFPKFSTPQSRYAPHFRPNIITAKTDCNINKEDLKLWVERRKKNYPKQSKKDSKEEKNFQKDETEELVAPKLSQLEIKLRKKIKIMNSQFDKKGKIKEKYFHDLQNFVFEKNLQADQTNKISQKNAQIDPKAGPILENPEKNHLDKKNKKFKKKNKLKLQTNEKTIEKLIRENENTNEENYINDIIENIKLQQSEQNKEWESLLDFKGNSSAHHYKINNLTRSLILDEIYKEKTFILQGLHFLAQENHLDKEDEKIMD